MYIGVIEMELFLDGATDLKYKKSVLQKIKSRLKSNFNISISEISEDPDFPDYILLGIASVSNDPKKLNPTLTKILETIEALSLGRIESDSREILFYEPSTSLKRN